MAKINFKLDADEMEFVNCLIENVLIRQRIRKYAKGHGHHIAEGKPFTYDKETGEVEYEVSDTQQRHEGMTSTFRKVYGEDNEVS